MKFEDVVSSCHVRSAIYRTGDPIKTFTEDDLAKIHPSLQELNKDKLGKKVPKRYWKNHTISLKEQVPISDQIFDDWEEYDPRDDDDSSLFMFND